MNLATLVCRAALRFPQGVATICGERRHDWSTVEGRIAQLAGALLARVRSAPDLNWPP